MTSIEIGIYALALVCIAAFLWFVLHSAAGRRPASAVKAEPVVIAGKRTHCILCGAVLGKGDKLLSKEIVREKDSVVHMYGCPFCHGDKGSNSRTCPVCKKAMSRDDYLIGRMWMRKNGKKHLHIAGCRTCAGKV